MNLGIRRLFAGVLVALAAAAMCPRASADATTDERNAEVKLLKIINHARDGKTLKALKEHDVIREEAEGWSAKMAEQGGLSHNGLQQRENRIAKADTGIDADKICELVASAKIADYRKAMRGVFKAWRADDEKAKCLFDGEGYDTQSAGVGAVFADNVWWITFIAAHDETPGS